jgi:hypothetical protein
MTSAAQYISNIDPTYPIPGKSNDSQGFRDNFNNIQTALSNLNNYMNGLAATTLNVDAPFVTATIKLTTLETLEIGDRNNITHLQPAQISVGADGSLVLIGYDNSTRGLAAGSIALMPNIVEINISSISPSPPSITAYNTTTGILLGATFQVNNTGTVYTVTGVDGPVISLNVPPDFPGETGAVSIQNPIFSNFTVINASTVTNLIAQALNNPAVFSDTTNSTSPSTGAVVFLGGIGVEQDEWIGGDLYVEGNIYNTGTISTVQIDTTNTNVSGTAIIDTADIQTLNIMNGGSIATVITASSFVNNLPVSGIGGGTAISGYNCLPGGILMQWGYAPSFGAQDFPVSFSKIFSATGTRYSGSGSIGEFGVTVTLTTISPGTNGNSGAWSWFVIGM